VIGEPTVRSDGTFRETTRRPVGRFAGTSSARYAATIGGVTSKAVKLTRRLGESRVTYSGGRLHVRGRISGPLASGERVRVMRGDTCGEYRQVGSVRLSRSGTFDGSVAFRSDEPSVAIRLQARVRGEDSTFTTFSLAQLLSLP
jgi:hypothetical protein